MWTRGIRFDRLELLGEGSQGCVYKALRRDTHSQLAQTVAIKILHSENAVELWKNEFESLSRVRSPYCVQVFAFERIERRPALVLEYVEGVSLAELGQSCWLECDDVEEIICQTELGLLDLHSHGSFHGDLSPQNVLIDCTGRVRLLDFGLANCGGQQTRLTPEFSAPERLAGAPAGLLADLFSLGRIEQFLKGESFTMHSASSYLSFVPEKRSPRAQPPCPERQQRLARKVVDLRERRRRARQMGTQIQNHQRPPSFQANRWPALTGAIISFFFLLATSGASQLPSREEIASILIRTHHWHQLRLNGQPLGYAPLNLVLKAGVRHELEWRSRKGEGKRFLVVKPGQQLILGDRDFSH